MVAHDRDANGDFLGANELVVVATGDWTPVPIGDLAIDSMDRVAFLFRRSDTNALVLAYDRSGDGDFDDTVGGTPELYTVVSGIFTCGGLSFDSSDHLALVYATASGTTKMYRDLNGNGDVLESGEFSFLSPTAAQGACDIVGGAGLGLAAVQDAGGDLHLLVDRNDDGDFVDTDEDIVLDTANPGPFEIRRDGTGRVVVATPTQLFADPI